MRLDRRVRVGVVWLRRVALLVVALLAAGGVLQQVATWREARQFPPYGTMVETTGHRLHVVEAGDRAPTVVLEAPTGGSHLGWVAVAAEVSRFTRVLSYDRAGYGWSQSASTPRTAGAMVDDLRRLLEARGEPGPFVLVGQSFGGLIVRLYALRHPEEVGGLVLVDPAHEEMFERLPAARAEVETLRKTVWGFRVAARVGALRLLDMPLGEGSSRHCPAELRPAARAVGFRATWVDALAAEIAAIDTSLRQTADAAVLGGPTPLGDAPVVVLSRGQPDDESEAQAYAVTLALHRDLLGMSSRSRHEVVEGAGHFIQVDRPRAVAAAIREVVESYRAADTRGPARSAARPASHRPGRSQAHLRSTHQGLSPLRPDPGASLLESARCRL